MRIETETCTDNCLACSYRMIDRDFQWCHKYLGTLHEGSLDLPKTFYVTVDDKA